jgi:DNA-binding MarR family transcriptional regulator
MQPVKIESKYFLCTQLTRAARRIVAYYNRELAQWGLTAQQLIALGILILEEDISLGQFAKRLKMGKAGAATMITRLEVLGLVTKEPDPKDGRLNILKITDKARKLHSKIQKTVLNLENTIESQMGDSNLREFVAHLSTFLDLEF